MTAARTVERDAWREEIAGVLARGGAPRSLFGARAPDGTPEVRCLAAGPEGAELLVCPAPGGRAPSVAVLAPWLDWDEREARDLHGIAFDGHEPHRPLVRTTRPTWRPGRRRSRRDDVHQVAVGPIHAGVIESGHFRFHCVGERILHVDVRLFHKHRGLEAAAEGLDAEDALPVVQRACAGCASANTVAFAHAVEQARGLWADDRDAAGADDAAGAGAPLEPPERPRRDLRRGGVRARAR